MAFEQATSSFYQTNSGANFGFDTADNSFQQNSYSAVGASSASSYEVDGSASFSASPELTGRQSAFEAGSSSYDFIGNGQNLSADAFTSASSFNATSGNEQSSAATKYAVNAQGLFHDPNPRIIRRPAPENARQYVQRVLVKFLQPPPLPPPGPLIIKEVRPPQPPAPPPLYIRQRPPPPPVLPPVVIREAPPKMPPAVPAQIITKTLPALPIPPRSVIIERLPPLPPKPRDVIVERWLPYRTQQKRQVIIQRAPPAPVQKPRNIIIYYEAPKARIVRRFLNLGVQRANPQDYVARYGTQLEDSQSLLQHARQVGVVEDISSPITSVANGSSNVQSASYRSYQTVGSADGTFDVVPGPADRHESSSQSTRSDGTHLDFSGAAGLSVGNVFYGLVDEDVSGNFSSGSHEVSSTSYKGNGVSGGFNFEDDLKGVNGSFSSYQSYSSGQSYGQ